MKKNILIFGLAGFLLSQSLFAQSGVRIEAPDFVGNGCNRGTASAAITDDGQTLSILFDNYIAEAGGNLRQRNDRKACNVLIPIVVPRGYSVAVFKVDYRGFNSLPNGAESQFAVDYFFGGRLGPRNTQRFVGPLENDFTTNNNLSGANLEWSRCGGRTMVLRAHSVLKVSTNAQREQTLAAVDSADVQASMTYHLRWRRCEGRN